MDKEALRIRSLRTSAFVATVLATGALTTCTVVYPLIFGYIQSFESNIQSDIELCRVRTPVLNL